MQRRERIPLPQTPSERTYVRQRRRQPAHPPAGARERPRPERAPQATGTSERTEDGQAPPRLRQDETAQLLD